MITLHFDFRHTPIAATDAIADAVALIKLAQASPLGCRVEIVRNGVSEGFADAIAEQVGSACKITIDPAPVAIDEDQASALAMCRKALEEMAFAADDLRFILVLLTMCWGKQPAALLAQLHKIAGANPA